MIFFTSDLHFGHRLMVKERKFVSVDEMNEHIIEEWNKVVSDNDVVYLLGDVAFMNPKQVLELLNRLKGTIHLIKGNHDSDDLIKKIKPRFASIDVYKKIKVDECYVQKPIQDIIMFHYPIAIWDKSHWGSFHLHGHSHGNYQIPDRFILDVGIDNIFKLLGEYRPISLEEVIAYMKTEDIGQSLDHHDPTNPR
jgi:calcineurin-like phosphoesterase family protein